MTVSKSFALPADPLAPPSPTDAGRFGRRTVAAIGAVGAAASLAWACLRALRYPRIYLPLTFAQVWEIGIASLPLVLLVSMIAGAVTSEQTGYQYSSTLRPWIVGSVITASVITELGPLSTGLVLVGRVGARIGAELGAMSVTEQIQALRTLGRDPVVYLVLPRVLAALVAVPALVALADAGGMLAGWAVALVRVPITTSEFSAGARASEAFARASDLLSPDHVARLERGVNELTALTVALRGTAARLRSRLDDERLDSTAADLTRTARTLTGVSAELRTASTSLASILTKVDRGNGALGRAVNDPTLYEALLTATAHVDEAATGASALVRDVRARPGRYIHVSLF